MMSNKNMLVLLSVAAFLLTLSPAFAINFNLQPYTSCKSGVCTTSLDVSTLGLNAAKINALKTVNITNFLTKSGMINNFAYSWAGNVITITGTVKSDVYWSFGAGGDTYDPWWNYSITGTPDTVSVGINSQGATNNVDKQGNRFTVINPCVLVNATKHASDTSTKAYLYNATDGSQIAVATFSGTVATFSPVVPLVNGSDYYIAEWSDGAGKTIYVRNPGPSYPITGRDISIITGAYYDTEWHEDGLGRGIDNITTINTTQASVYYETFLYLNGNQSNITMANSTALNVSANTNLTGLNVSLFVNGILKNNTITESKWNSTLPAGLYNITAYFFNASTSSSLTYWADLTYTAPPIQQNLSITWNVNMNDAPGICLSDNMTFQRQTNISYGTVYQTLTENFTCPYNCSVNSCNPPPYQQNLIIFGVIMAMVIIMLVLVRLRRR